MRIGQNTTKLEFKGEVFNELRKRFITESETDEQGNIVALVVFDDIEDKEVFRLSLNID